MWLFLLFNRFTPPHPIDITNPNYMGVGYKSGGVTDRGWSYSMSPRSGSGGGGGVGGHGGKDQTHGNIFPKKTVYDHSAVRSPTGKAANNVYVDLSQKGEKNIYNFIVKKKTLTGRGFPEHRLNSFEIYFQSRASLNLGPGENDTW